MQIYGLWVVPLAANPSPLARTWQMCREAQMKILQILLVYFLALLVGSVILLLLSIPFPHLPGWVGLIVGVVVIIPTTVITNKITYG